MRFNTFINYLLIFGLSLMTIKAQSQSPYELNWKQETSILVGGAALLTAGVVKGFNLDPLTEDKIANLDPSNVNWFDRHATRNWSIQSQKYSDHILHVSYFLPLIPLINKTARKDIGVLAVLLLETTLITEGITASTKSWIARTRPFIYNPSVDLDEKTNRSARLSFISGHTSSVAMTSFFTAKVVTDYFPQIKNKPLIWTGAALLPAATAYFRYRGGKHFISDVVAGYAVGALAGILIPHFHKRDRENKKLSLGMGKDGASVAFTIELH